MSFTIPPILVYIASWLGMMGGVWALFDRAEKVVDPQVKEKISNWLLTANVSIDERWPATFEKLSDKIFGKKLFSYRGFFISALFSILTVAILIPLWYFLRPSDFENLTANRVIVLFIVIISGLVIFNVIQDYLSVTQTRFLLRRMAKTASTFIGQWSFLCLDFFLTTLLVVCSFLVIFMFFQLIFSGVSSLTLDFNPFEMLIRSLKFYPLFDATGSVPVSVFVYSTYLTSIWIWLYALSGIIFRISSKFSWTIEIVKKFLNIKEKPLQSLGFISMLIVTVVYLIIPFVVQS